MTKLFATIADMGCRTEQVEIDCPIHGKVKTFRAICDGEVIGGGCPKCSIERNIKEDEERRKTIEQQEGDPGQRLTHQLIKAGVNDDDAINRFENFEAYTLTLADTVAFAKELALGYKRYLVMFGTTGVGKTHIAVSALALASSRGRTILYTKELRLFREIHSTYNRNQGPTEKEVFAYFSSPEVLVIDELADEPISKHDLSILEDLIDDRNTSRKATILISNATIDKYKAHVGDKILSRIAAKGDTFQIVENDWRRKK